MENKVIIPVLQINDRKQEQMEKWESNAWKAVPFRGGSKPCLGRRNRRKQKKGSLLRGASIPILKSTD